MEQWKNFIRAMIRPFVMVSGWSAVLLMAWTGKPVPDFLLAFIAALTGFLFGERSARHNGPSNPP